MGQGLGVLAQVQQSAHDQVMHVLRTILNKKYNNRNRERIPLFRWGRVLGFSHKSSRVPTIRLCMFLGQLSIKNTTIEIEREFHCSVGAGSWGSHTSPAECPRSGYAIHVLRTILKRRILYSNIGVLGIIKRIFFFFWGGGGGGGWCYAIAMAGCKDFPHSR